MQLIRPYTDQNNIPKTSPEELWISLHPYKHGAETLLLSAAGLKKFEKKKHWERRVRRGDERFATGCVVGPQACLRAFAENRSDRAGRTGVLSDKPKGSLRA